MTEPPGRQALWACNGIKLLVHPKAVTDSKQYDGNLSRSFGRDWLISSICFRDAIMGTIQVVVCSKERIWDLSRGKSPCSWSWQLLDWRSTFLLQIYSCKRTSTIPLNQDKESIKTNDLTVEASNFNHIWMLCVYTLQYLGNILELSSMRAIWIM